MSRRSKEARRKRAQIHQRDAKRFKGRLAEMSELAAAMTVADYERMISSAVGGPLSADEQPPIAAVSIVKTMWRNTVVEDSHAGNGLDRISDGEMFAANVTLTKLVLKQYQPSGGTDWQALFDAVTDPDRILAGTRTTEDLVGRHYEQWDAQAARAADSLWGCEQTYGAERAHLMLVLASVYERWWGTPCWPYCVSDFERKHPGALSDSERQLLLEAPEQLPPDTLDRLVEAGLGFTDGFQVWRAGRAG